MNDTNGEESNVYLEIYESHKVGYVSLVSSELKKRRVWDTVLTVEEI